MQPIETAGDSQKPITMANSDKHGTPEFPDTPDNPIDSSADLGPSPGDATDWQQKYAELETKHTDVADAYLRAKAEAENTRRRADEDISKSRKFAIESFAEALLPVMDSMEAAIAMPDAAPGQVLEGVHATLRQLASVLERNKVIEINPPPGSRFDPHQHQAISAVPAATAGQEPNTVVAVLQKGYLIADRMLRPALVTVTAPS